MLHATTPSQATAVEITFRHILNHTTFSSASVPLHMLFSVYKSHSIFLSYRTRLISYNLIQNYPFRRVFLCPFPQARLIICSFSVLFDSLSYSTLITTISIYSWSRIPNYELLRTGRKQVIYHHLLAQGLILNNVCTMN